MKRILSIAVLSLTCFSCCSVESNEENADRVTASVAGNYCLGDKEARGTGGKSFYSKGSWQQGLIYLVKERVYGSETTEYWWPPRRHNPLFRPCPDLEGKRARRGLTVW